MPNQPAPSFRRIDALGRLRRPAMREDPLSPIDAEELPHALIQARGALKQELLGYLWRTRAMRRSRHRTQKADNHGRISGTVSIRERPAAVEDRAVPGHWEGDLLFGGSNSQIATLVERHTRCVMLVKVSARDTESVMMP